MVFEYKFDPENFSYSEGWKEKVNKIDVDSIANKILKYYENTRGITRTEKSFYKKILGTLQENEALQAMDKEYKTWEFDITHKKISRKNRENFLELEGMIFEKIHTPHKDGRKAIPMSFEDKDQYDYFVEHLAAEDIMKRPQRADGRHELTIRNPAFAYYFDNDLPALDIKSQNALLRGVITGCCLKSTGKDASHMKKRDTVVFITRNQRVFKYIEMLCGLNKLWVSPADYDEVQRGNIIHLYSNLFMKPTELTDFIIQDKRFNYIPEKLKELTDFTGNIGDVFIQQTLLSRAKIFHTAKAMGLLDAKEHQALLNDFDTSKEKLRELKEIKKNLTKKQGMLEYFKQQDEISTEVDVVQQQINREKELYSDLYDTLFASKKAGTDKRKGSDVYGKKQVKELKARERANNES